MTLVRQDGSTLDGDTLWYVHTPVHNCTFTFIFIIRSERCHLLPTNPLPSFYTKMAREKSYVTGLPSIANQLVIGRGSLTRRDPIDALSLCSASPVLWRRTNRQP
ncbi:hypothetical protein L249_1358, partial [Ophiocordyceps polyrhachis-furcata BCC 54312]